MDGNGSICVMGGEVLFPVHTVFVYSVHMFPSLELYWCTVSKIYMGACLILCHYGSTLW
jgi:hypothetical protein